MCQCDDRDSQRTDCRDDGVSFHSAWQRGQAIKRRLERDDYHNMPQLTAHYDAETSDGSSSIKAGGVFPILVGGRVNGKSAPVQKHPQPEGQSKPDPSQEFQQEICVT